MGCQASNTVTNTQTPKKRLSKVNNADVIATIKRASVNSMYVYEVQKNGQSVTMVPQKGISIKNNENQQNDYVRKSQMDSLTESQESNPHSQSQSHQQRPNQSNSSHTSSSSPRSSCSSQPQYPSRQKFTQITITINKPHKNKRQKQKNSQKSSCSSSSPSQTQRKIAIGNNNDELKQNYNNNSSSHLMDASNSYASSKQVSNSSLSMSLARFNSERML